MKKNFVSFTLTAAILASLSATALAETSTNSTTETNNLQINQNVTAMLRGCDIISEDDLSELDKTLTRGEFAEIISRMMLTQDQINSMAAQMTYKDVPADSPYAKYIASCTTYGYMNGFSDDEFSPDGNIYPTQAVKTIVSCLGYGSMAESSGGYPVGYTSIGSRIGIHVYGSDKDGMTKYDAYRMVYEALDVTMMDTLVGPFGESSKQETLKEYIFDKKNIEEGVDIVYGNVYYSVSDDYANSKDKIKIGDDVILVGDVNIDDIIGRKVKYYYMETLEGDKLTYASPMSYNEVVTIDKDEFQSFEDGKLVYYENGSKEKSVKVDTDNYRFIYNHQVKDEFEDEDFDGDILLIDNNKDNKYDYILVENSKTYQVSRISSDEGVINFEINSYHTPGEVQALENMNDIDDRTVIIEDSDGNPLTFADIKPKDVLTIIASENDEYLNITVEKRYIEGSVTALDKNGNITVDGTIYKTAVKADDEYVLGIDELGLKGRFYLNENNEIIYFTEDASLNNNYGYVIKTWQEPGSEALWIKMLLPGKIQYHYEEHDDGTETKSLKASNDTIVKFECDLDLKIDSKKMSVEEIINTSAVKQGDVISYETDNEGKIFKINKPETYYNTGNLSASRKFLTFSDSRPETEADATVFAFSAVNFGGFRVSEDKTAVFCLPPEPGEEKKITGDANYKIGSDDDYYDIVTMNNGTSYYTRAYEFDEESGIVEVFAIVSGLNSDRSDEVLSTEEWAIVNDVQEIVNDENEVVYNITGYKDGKSFDIQSLGGDAGGLSREIANLTKGDILKFTQNTTGKLYAMSSRDELFSLAGDLTLGSKGFYSPTDGELYGAVESIQRKIIDESTTRYTNVINVDYGDGTVSIKAPYATTNFYIYDTSSREDIKVATEEDVYSYMESGSKETCSRIFAKVDELNNAEIVVIVKY